MNQDSGRCALVTRAANGIGLAVAENLASSGVRVLLADLDEKAGTAEHEHRGDDAAGQPRR